MSNLEKFQFSTLIAKNHIEIKEADLPKIKNDEVLIKQEACNICTTDYQQWEGKREHQGYPMAGGHECAGTGIQTGRKVENSFKIGDKVSIIYDYCGDCDACKNGFMTNCENVKQFGKNYSDTYYGIFGFANYFVRKAKSLVKMSKDLEPSEAAFVEPLSSVLKGINRLDLKAGFDTVAIIGGGTMGLLNAMVAELMGARVIISERNSKRVKKIKSLGYEVIDAGKEDPVKSIHNKTGKGTDTVIVCVGTSSANQQAVDMMKPNNGKVLMFSAGYPSPELDISSNFIHYSECELIGTYGSTLKDFQNAAHLLNHKKINVKPLIENKVPLSDIQEAFDQASQRGSYRISVLLQK